jgi:hypothetical protein
MSVQDAQQQKSRAQKQKQSAAAWHSHEMTWQRSCV